MNKQQFFNELNSLLKSLPSKERKKTNTYYNEIINDYIEDGLSEEQAISRLGDVQEIANDIMGKYFTCWFFTTTIFFYHTVLSNIRFGNMQYSFFRIINSMYYCYTDYAYREFSL